MKYIFTQTVVLSIIFTLLLLTSKSATSQTSVNNGESIQSAIDNASSGEVITVNSGTYSEKILFNGSNDGGITLTANGNVTLDGGSLSPNGREGLITISNASSIRVEGFILKNFKTTATDDTPMGILIDNGSSNIQLINNTISEIEHNKTNCSQNNDCYVGAHGIGVFGNTTSVISNILIQGNEVFNCELMSSEAFVLNGNIDGFEIYDNIVHDNDNIGFDFIGYEPYDCASCTPEQLRVKNGIVAGNQAYRNSSGSNPWYTGDRSAGGFYVDGGRNIMFAGNISYENDFGFEFASEWNNRKTENILMVNNLVYNNTVTGLVMGGYSSSTGNTGNGGGGGSAENIYVYNNTFYNNQSGTSYYATEVTFQYRVKNSNFSNNIFYTKGNTSDIYNTWCGTCNNSNTGNTWSNNIWYGDAGTSGAVPGTNTIKTNPQFVTIGSNFALASNSPAISAGSIQSDLTNWNDSYWTGFFYANGNIPAHGTLVGSTVVDGAGNNRFQSTIDAGAYEYGTGATTVPVTSISVTPANVSLSVGDTQSLTPIISPSNATNKSVSWSSSQTSVATVSSNGLVTAQSVGTTTITATSVDGNKADTSVIMVSGSSTGENLTQNSAAIASQSTNYSNTLGLAELAIDGNQNGRWSGESVTHTKSGASDTSPWWKVDLGSTKAIGDIIIYNRTDCCESRLDDITVSIENGSGTEVWSQNLISNSLVSLIVDANGISGRVIRIRQNNSSAPLSLAEVEVYEDDNTNNTFPDPSKIYYVDAMNGKRLAATGESEDAYTASQSTTGANVEWSFVAKGNGFWHLRRAAGGTKPGIRTDNSTYADMQGVGNTGIYTYYELTEKIAGSEQYHLTLPDGPTSYRRLQLHRTDGSVRMTSTASTGTWVTFTFTEVPSSTSAASAKSRITMTEEFSSAVRIAPNPVENVLNILIERGNTYLEFDILDISGKIVIAKSNITGEKTRLDVSQFPEGIYILRMYKSDSSIETLKFIK